MAEPKSEFVTILGARVHVRRAGRGAPLLFLHGAGGVPVWLPFHDKLAERFELLVPDHPSFGRSDTPDWWRNIGDAAYFYLDFIAALKLGGVHVVGASMGGWIAAEIAVRDCAALKRLSLIAPAGVRVKGIQTGDIFIWAPDEAVRNLYFDQAIAERILAVPPTPEQIDMAIKNRYAAARLGWQPRLFNPDLERWLHRIAAPLQLLWGDDDKVIPAAYAAAWRKALPKSKLVAFAKCGHLPHVEYPDEAAAAIAAFDRAAETGA